MTATIIRLADHRAVKPKVSPGILPDQMKPTLSGSLDILAQNIAVVACGIGRPGTDRKAASSCLWRFSEGVQEMIAAAEKLERKYRKAKKRLKRR